MTGLTIILVLGKTYSCIGFSILVNSETLQFVQVCRCYTVGSVTTILSGEYPGL